MTIAVAVTSSWAWAWDVVLQFLGVNGSVCTTLGWSQNGFSVVRQCLQTYWERSTNFVCNENLFWFWHSIGEILFCKIVPLKTNIFISIMLNHSSTENMISQESIMDSFEVPLFASLLQIMGQMIFFFFFGSFPISVAMRSSLLDYVLWNWKKVQWNFNDAWVGCNFFQEMPACAIDDACTPVW